MKACERKWMRCSEESRESEITRRVEAKAKAEDGCHGEGEGGKAFRRPCVNPRRWPRIIPSPRGNARHQPIPNGLRMNACERELNAPTGHRPPAQGCEERATLGMRPQMEANPNGVVTKTIRLASRRICRNRVAVVSVLPRSPKVGAGAPTLGFGPQPRWGWRETDNAVRNKGTDQ